MNNDIKYFYDIEITQIHQQVDKKIFHANNFVYSLEECDIYVQDIEKIYKQNQYMFYNNIPIYKIILNRFNKIVTKINDKNYILLQINGAWNQQLKIEDLINYQYPYFGKREYINNIWKKLWMEKIDYFEYQMSQCGIKYPLIRESMSYFVGLSENAISMLNENNNPSNLFFQHRRISCHSNMYDFMNPLNIIADVRIRDICEYYKSRIIDTDSTISIEEIINKLMMNKNDLSDITYFYIRLYFPTYYFDMYEDIISNGYNEKKVEKILKSTDRYCDILIYISLAISKYIVIPNIEWIKKSRYVN